jgi:Leucine-rich repeat (LRR) protein
LVGLGIVEPNVEEAERRIAAARATGAESLDLGDLGLPELPASLGELNHLRTLYLGAHALSDAGEIEWKAERVNTELATIQPLAGLRTLQRLFLSDCKGVTDIAPLEGLIELQSLSLHGCTGVTNLASLRGLQKLKFLTLYFCTERTYHS